MRIPIAKEGYPFIAPAFVMAVLSLPWPFYVSGFFILLFVFVTQFFRDPEREVPEEGDAVVSPADGRVIKVEVLRDDRFLKEEVLRICVFMNVFNVHVNRSPYDGTVEDIIYNEGKFFPADKDKASLENEQNALIIKIPTGERIAFNQIAGLVARRIVCNVKPGSELRKGERFGMIRFGSRVDIYMPKETVPAVKVGDKVSAGSSIIARLTS